MRWILLAIALVFSANTLGAEPPPEKETDEAATFTEAMEPVEPDPVRDTKFMNGWVKHTDGGWIVYPEDYYDTSHPPVSAYLKSVVTERMFNILCGVLVIVVPVAFWIFLRRRARRKARKGGDLNAVEYASVIRQLKGMTTVLNELTKTPEDRATVNTWADRKRRTNR